MGIGGRRSAVVLALLLLFPACGGGSEDPPAEVAEQPAAEDDMEVPPLEVPDDCPASASDLEIWTLGSSWANAKGKPYEVNEACLTAEAGSDIDFTIHNPRTKGVINLEHNFSIYSDSIALDRLFLENPVKPGKDKTFTIPALEAGTYLFRCDLHGRTMRGILVVE